MFNKAHGALRRCPDGFLKNVTVVLEPAAVRGRSFSDQTEVTERRLECLERGEKLPEPLRNLPPVQISAQAIVARLRGGEAEEAPELLELTLLPESRASQLRRAELLVPSPAQLQRIARERAPELLEKGEELLERAPELLDSVESGLQRVATNAVEGARSWLREWRGVQS